MNLNCDFFDIRFHVAFRHDALIHLGPFNLTNQRSFKELLYMRGEPSCQLCKNTVYIILECLQNDTLGVFSVAKTVSKPSERHVNVYTHVYTQLV